MGRPRRATAEPVSYAENTKDSFLASAMSHTSKGMGQYITTQPAQPTQRKAALSSKKKGAQAVHEKSAQAPQRQKKRERKVSTEFDSIEANKENLNEKVDKANSKSKTKKSKEIKAVKRQAGDRKDPKPTGLSKRTKIQTPSITNNVVAVVKPNAKTGLGDTIVTARSDPSLIWSKYQELIRIRTTDAEENCELLRKRIDELRQAHRREIKNLTEGIEQAKKGQARSENMVKVDAKAESAHIAEIKKLKSDLSNALKEQKQVAVSAKSEHKDAAKLHKTIKKKTEELDDMSEQIQLIATERDELHNELLTTKADIKSLTSKLKKSSGSQSQDLKLALDKNAELLDTIRISEDLIQTYADLTGIIINQIPGSQKKLDCSLIQKDGQELAFYLTWSEDESEIEYTPFESNIYGSNIQDYLQEIFVFKIEMLRKFFLTLSKCC